MIKINCELCGKIDERLNRALIEGVELNVCIGCAKFGKILGSVKKPILLRRAEIITENKDEKIELLVEDYATVIKKRREAMGLTQKDFSNKINEKESVIHKIETGALEPSLSLAKKLEKFLGVKLVEEHHEKHEQFNKSKGGGFTLGDFIKLKR